MFLQTRSWNSGESLNNLLLLAKFLHADMLTCCIKQHIAACSCVEACRYDGLFTLHCTAHALDLALESICDLPYFSDPAKVSKKIIKVLTNHHTTSALSSPSPNCSFSSQVTQGFTAPTLLYADCYAVRVLFERLLSVRSGTSGQQSVITERKPR